MENGKGKWKGKREKENTFYTSDKVGSSVLNVRISSKPSIKLNIRTFHDIYLASQSMPLKVANEDLDSPH